MIENYEFKKLKQICKGDGIEIRYQLILAGLLMMVFERFKKYIVGQVDSFFADSMTFEKQGIIYKRGKVFKDLIKKHGKGGAGQHGNEAFRTSLKWFLDLEAITNEEFSELERLYALRNDIGHELFSIVADDNKNHIDVSDVLTIYTVYLKIVRWWIKEIEASTDPDFDYDNTDFDSVESTDTIFLREIIKKALLGPLEVVGQNNTNK